MQSFLPLLKEANQSLQNKDTKEIDIENVEGQKEVIELVGWVPYLNHMNITITFFQEVAVGIVEKKQKEKKVLVSMLSQEEDKQANEEEEGEQHSSDSSSSDSEGEGGLHEQPWMEIFVTSSEDEEEEEEEDSVPDITPAQ